MNHIKSFDEAQRAALVLGQSEELIRRAGLTSTPTAQRGGRSSLSGDDMQAVEDHILDLAPLPAHIKLTAIPAPSSQKAGIELTARVGRRVAEFDWEPPCLCPSPAQEAAIKAHIKHGDPLPDGLTARLIPGTKFVHVSDSIGRMHIG